MKKTVISALLLIMMILVFASCSGNTEPEKEPDTNDISVTSEMELASILADENASNYDKNAAKHSMARIYIAKANEYREKIKDEYRKLREESPDLYSDELFPLEENLKKVDEYIDYLENEFERNIAFFESYAAAKYHTGTAGSSLLADEEYKAAERFYLKAAEIYNNLAKPDSLGDFKNPQLLESGINYDLYQVSENPALSSDDIDYWFRILGNNSEVVTEFGTSWKIPTVTEKDGIVCVTVNKGTSSDYSRFYDSERDILSVEYFNVLAWENDNICYIDPPTRNLIIRKAFDDVSKEFDIDFYYTADPVTDAEFISDSELRITYYAPDFTEKTEIINF